MANDNFGNGDRTWGVTIGEKDFDSFRDFWGDEYNWNSLVPITWAALDLPRFRVKPPSVANDFSPEFSWWIAPLHLLGLGLGWTDVAKGLHMWRRTGFETENHVLRSVYNTWGPSIEALEIWLKLSGNYDVFPKLYDLNTKGEAPEPFQFPAEDTKFQKAAFILKQNSGPRHQLTKHLVDEFQSHDGLHLTGHFIERTWGRPLDLDAEDPGWFFDSREARVTLTRYKNWVQLVRDSLQLYYGDLNLLPEDFSIYIDIANWGPLGWFKFSKQSGRFYRVSSGSGSAERDLRWHLLGN